MPTAAKLIAGFGLGLTAAIAAYLFALENDQYQIGLRFLGGNFLVGFFCGWFTLGKRYGYGNIAAIMNGLRSLVLLLAGSAMVFSAIFIFGNLQNNNFRDPTDLPLLWIETSFDYIVLALKKNVLIALVIGGILSGIATFQASLRWR